MRWATRIHVYPYWENRVVCVEERFGDNLPRVVPGEIFFVNQNTHEFWNGQCGVCLVGALNRERSLKFSVTTHIVELNGRIWNR